MRASPVTIEIKTAKNGYRVVFQRTDEKLIANFNSWADTEAALNKLVPVRGCFVYSGSFNELMVEVSTGKRSEPLLWHDGV